MVTNADILAKIKPYLTQANKVNPKTPLYRSQDQTGTVYIYRIPKTNPQVLVYSSSAAVDCDGLETSQCNPDTDPAYQNDTSFHTSNDKPLNAALLPFYVLPIAGSSYFDYTKHNISGGQLGLVLYGTRRNFGVFGDENADEQSTGEVSYAMANSLGIDPDPSTGGVSSGVTYIIFTGGANVVDPIENHNLAVSKGNAALTKMLNQLSTTKVNVTVRATIQQGKGNIVLYKNGRWLKKICCNQGTYGEVLLSKGDILKVRMFGYTGYQFDRWCRAPCSGGGSKQGTFQMTVGTSNINLYGYFKPVCMSLGMQDAGDKDDISTTLMHIETLAAENAVMRYCISCHSDCMYCPVGGLQAKFGFMRR